MNESKYLLFTSSDDLEEDCVKKISAIDSGDSWSWSSSAAHLDRPDWSNKLTGNWGTVTVWSQRSIHMGLARTRDRPRQRNSGRLKECWRSRAIEGGVRGSEERGGRVAWSARARTRGLPARPSALPLFAPACRPPRSPHRELSLRNATTNTSFFVLSVLLILAFKF